MSDESIELPDFHFKGPFTVDDFNQFLYHHCKTKYIESNNSERFVRDLSVTNKGYFLDNVTNKYETSHVLVSYLYHLTTAWQVARSNPDKPLAFGYHNVKYGTVNRPRAMGCLLGLFDKPDPDKFEFFPNNLFFSHVEALHYYERMQPEWDRVRKIRADRRVSLFDDDIEITV